MSLSLDRFPNEVLLQILKKCDVETLLELRKVSERFNDVATKVLRDKKLVGAYLKMVSPDYFCSINGKEVFTIDSAVVRSEDFQLEDYLPDFMAIKSMTVKGDVHDECFADAARILDFIPSNWLRYADIAFLALRFSSNEFKLLKAMENKLSKRLNFKWNSGRKPKVDISREVEACLTMFRSNRGTLKYVEIKGHFSAVEMAECFGQAELGVFLLNPGRIAEGDLSSFTTLIDNLVSKPRSLDFTFDGPNGMLSVGHRIMDNAWAPVIEALQAKFGLQIGDVDYMTETTVGNETWDISVLMSSFEALCCFTVTRRNA